MNLKTSAFETTILKLNIARISLSLYPPGHQEVQRAITVAYQRTSSIIKQQGRFFLELADDDTPTVNRYALNQDNLGIKEFIACLVKHDLYSILFKPGLRAVDLQTFMERLSRNPSQENFNTDIACIEIETVSYSGYTLVAGSNASEQKKPLKHSHSQGYIDLSQQSEGGIEQPNPSRPSGMVQRNRHNYSSDTTSGTYSALLNDLKEHAALEQKNNLDHAKRADYLKDVLASLNPVLKEQLMSLPQIHSMDKDSLEDLARLLTSLDYYQVIKMLEKANQEQKEISPSLFRMVQTVASTMDDPDHEASQEDDDEFILDELRSPASSEDLFRLFNRENYESYVEQNYDVVLKRIMIVSKELSYTPDSLNLSDLKQSLSRIDLEVQFIQSIFDMGLQSLSMEDIKLFIRYLSKNILALLESRKLTLVHKIHGKLRKISRSHSDEKIRDTAKTGLAVFRQASFITNALNILKRSHPQETKKLICLLFAQGPSVLDEIIPWCGRQLDLLSNRSVLELVSRFSDSAIRAIESFCSSPSPLFLKNMMILLAKCPPGSAISCLERLAPALQPDLRIEALKTMIALNHKPALEQLLYFLEPCEDINDFFYHAAQGAVQLRLKQAVPVLVLHLQTANLSSDGLAHQKFIINVLGKIGDSAAIPALVSILNRKFSFHPRRLTELKNSIYASLDGYDPDIEHNISAMGSANNKNWIKSICAGFWGQTKTSIIQ